MPSLFLSHAGVDSDAAIALAKRIEESPEAVAAGLQVWIDKADLRTGRRWKGGLQDALAQSTAFAVYVGSRGIVNWVQDEVDVALDKAHDPSDPDYPLIPVLAAGIDPRILPSFLSQFQGVADVERDGEAFNRLLRAVLRLEPRAAVGAVDEPFVGLRAFDSSKAHLFFGRKTDVDTLVGLLRGETLVMVTGDSGSGKSSLVKAGLVPAFRGGCLGQPRDQGLDETIWQVVETRPGSEPFGRLADDLRDTARRAGIAVDEASRLAAMVRPNAGKSPSPDAVRDALLSSLPADIAGRGKYLVVVDQFEEFRTATSAADYVAALLRLADPGDDRIRVVLTMRRDYYFACASFPPLYARLEANDRRARLVLHRMTKEHLHEAVSEPLKLTKTPEAQRSGLADAVVRDAGDEAGELAVLQFALWRTWQTRRDHSGDLLAAYNALGRVDGALANEAERVFLGLSPEEQARAETLFVRLVRPGEAAGVTRRIARLDEFEPATQTLAQKLSLEEQFRLLTLGEGTVEIAHEQLATQWGRYQGWIGNVGGDRRGDDLRVLQRLIDAAAKATGDDDLARGGDLADFERLAGTRPTWLSTVEEEFVDRSKADRKREKREREERVRTAEALAERAQELAQARRRQLLGSVAATLALLAFAVFAGWQWSAAIEAKKTATQAEMKAVASAERAQAATADAVAQQYDAVRQRALAEQSLAAVNRALAVAIWNDLPETASDMLPVRTQNALWQLAAGRASLAAPFLEELTSAPDRPLRFAENFDAVVRAIYGPSGPTAEQAQEALVPVVDAITTANNANSLPALDRTVEVLAARLGAEQAETALVPVLDAITDSDIHIDQLLALARTVEVLAARLGAEQAQDVLISVVDAIATTTDADQLAALAQVVAALGPSPTQAQAVLVKVVDGLMDSDIRSIQFPALAQVVVALGPSPTQARAVLIRVVDAITTTTSHRYELSTLAQVVAALGPSPTQAQAVLVQIVDASTNSYFNSEELPALAQTVEALAARLGAEQAQAVLVPVVDAIATARHYQQALAQTFVALAARLGVEQAQSVLVRVVDAITNTSEEYYYRALAQVVVALGPSSTQAQVVLVRVVDAITSSRLIYGEQTDLAQTVEALAARLGAEQAQVVLVRVVDAITSSRLVYGEQTALAQIVEALAARLDAEQAQAVLLRVADAITSSRLILGELPALAQTVEALAARLGAEQAQAVLVRVVDAIADSAIHNDQLPALTQALVAFGPSPTQAQAALVRVVDAIMTTSDEYYYLPSLTSAVVALGPSPTQAQAVLASVVDAIATTSDVNMLADLAPAVVALGPSPTQAQAVLVSVLDAITNTTDLFALQALAQAVEALAPKLERPGTQTETDALRSALAWAEGEPSEALASAYAALLPREPQQEFVTAVVTPIGLPIAAGPATDVLIEALREVGGPGAEAGLDATLAWLRDAYPDVDPDAVPVCPPPPAGWEGLQCPPV